MHDGGVTLSILTPLRRLAAAASRESTLRNASLGLLSEGEDRAILYPDRPCHR
jgi:hypothetical protein